MLGSRASLATALLVVVSFIACGGGKVDPEACATWEGFATLYADANATQSPMNSDTILEQYKSQGYYESEGKRVNRPKGCNKLEEKLKEKLEE